MAQLRELSQGKWEAYKIDPREIEIRPGFNFRDTSTPEAQRHIAWLAESIAERGVDEPVWVENKDGKFYLVAGECRLLALRSLWDKGNEVFVPTFSYKGDEASVLAKSISENTGLPPTILEFGKAAERLVAFGWTVEQIAALTPPHLGLQGAKAKRFVKTALELHQAPAEVKAAVAHGVEGVEVSPALAVQAVRKSRDKAHEIVTEAVQEAKAEGKTIAKREKKPGKVAKQREAATERDAKLYEAGDRMATLILADEANWTEAVKAAKQWQKLRD